MANLISFFNLQSGMSMAAASGVNTRQTTASTEPVKSYQSPPASNSRGAARSSAA